MIVPKVVCRDEPAGRVVRSAGVVAAAPGDAMPCLIVIRQRAFPRIPRVRAACSPAIVRALGLVALLLLPVQMRAGGADVHPHALLQLMLDARDGSFDHHEGDHAIAGHTYEPVRDEVTSGNHEPDLPSMGDASHAGGMAILGAIVIIFTAPRTEADRAWVIPNKWCGLLLAPEPPPPRFARV
jgi:hypothetical protein